MFTNLFHNSNATVVFKAVPQRNSHKYTRTHVQASTWGSSEGQRWNGFLTWFHDYSRDSSLSQLHKQTKYELFKLVHPKYEIGTYPAEDRTNIYEIARLFASEPWCDNRLAYLNKAIGTDKSDFSEHVWKLACYYTSLESSGTSKLLKAFNQAYCDLELQHRLYWMQEALEPLTDCNKSIFSSFFIQKKGLTLYELLEDMGYSDKLKIDVLINESKIQPSVLLPSI